MLRVLSALALMLCAAPALAQQTCKTTRVADGQTTLASVKLKGVEAHDVMLDTGPLTAKITFDATAKGYSVRKGEKAALFMFRRGTSQDGKDWRTAGTIAFEEGGFAFEWPHILLKGKPVEKVGIRFSTSDQTDTWTRKQDATRKREGLAFVSLLHETMPYHGYEALFFGYDEDEAYDIWADWRDALALRQPIIVEFLDVKTKAALAKVTFTPPDVATAQTRMVADVNALRTAFAENRCEAG